MDRLSEGFKQAIDKILGPTAKNGFLSRIRVFRPKKRSLLGSNYVLATTGKSCANKKVPFSQINMSLLADLWCFFFWKKKADFWPKKHFSVKRKNGRFSVIPPGIVIVSHVMAWTVPRNANFARARAV